MYFVDYTLSTDISGIASVFGKNGTQNFGLFSTDTTNQLLQDIQSQQAFDPDFLAQKITELQKYIHAQLPVIPLGFKAHSVFLNNSAHQVALSKEGDYLDLRHVALSNEIILK